MADAPYVPERPCPAYVVVTSRHSNAERRVYCEFPRGHEGTHVGDKSRWEYMWELREWRNSRRTRTVVNTKEL